MRGALVVACLLSFIVTIALAKSSKSLQAPLWDHNVWKNINVMSYITNSSLDPNNNAEPSDGNKFVGDLMKVIHANQHPPKEKCKSTRFLVIHMKTESLEGLCSLVKQVSMGLSTALHSNRTLIWGLYTGQFMFEATSDVWAGAKRDVILGGTRLSCPKGENPLGGPFECFFQQLSSCSMDDISPQELVDLQSNPFDDAERIKLMPVKVNGPRSVALFHPPAGLVDHIVNTYPTNLKQSLKPLLKTYGGHLWAASILSYVFRLKPDLLKQFSKKYSSRFASGEPVWGLHVRHGDVKSFHHFIRQKRVFSFESYFTVARDLSHVLGVTPSRIFVSTDSIRADEIPEMFDEFNLADEDVDEAGTDKQGNDRDDDEYEDDDDYETELEEDEEDLLPQHTKWFDQGDGGSSIPQIFSVNNTDRYRTEHGFVIAAAENCVDAVKKKGRKFCHVPHQFPVDVSESVYDGQQKILEADRAVRLMRMLLEAVEDLYLLSLSDVIIAQGSSHFSTAAIMLMWGRLGAKDLDRTTQFLDIDTMLTGDSASAFLQGTNLWNSSYVGPGDERWRIHTYRFISGLPRTDAMGTVPVTLSYDPWAPEMRMKMNHYVPQVPDYVFYRESKQWLGQSTEPAWPGRCIDSIESFDEQLITNLVNIGADHFQYMHAKEAQRCWLVSLAAASRWKARSSMMDVIIEVSAGNIGTILHEAREYALLAQQRGVDPASLGRINVFSPEQQRKIQEQQAADELAQKRGISGGKQSVPTATPTSSRSSTYSPSSLPTASKSPAKSFQEEDDDDYYDEEPVSPTKSSPKPPVKETKPVKASSSTKDDIKSTPTKTSAKPPAVEKESAAKSATTGGRSKALNKIIKKIEKLELELQLLKLELVEYQESVEEDA